MMTFATSSRNKGLNNKRLGNKGLGNKGLILPDHADRPVAIVAAGAASRSSPSTDLEPCASMLNAFMDCTEKVSSGEPGLVHDGGKTMPGAAGMCVPESSWNRRGIDVEIGPARYPMPCGAGGGTPAGAAPWRRLRNLSAMST